MALLDDRLLWIGGQYVAASDDSFFDTLNPATGEVICRVARAGAEDVDKAVAAAELGQREWAAMSGAERGRVLLRTAQLLRQHCDEIARLESSTAASRLPRRRKRMWARRRTAWNSSPARRPPCRGIPAGARRLLLYPTGATGHLRRHRCLELSGADSRVEIGTGTGGG
ncbi:aldehyde dehydrogenase family protein [Microbulbifer taiwanensis]|uniref:aldehyde dehydrogenase family protein n=1 Tax=Microbulbifer taiwanensis TaxID=986746 RepID=UPI0036067A6B